MDSSTLKNKTLSSIIWKFMERVLAQGVSFIVTIVLARILVPDDYSVVSIVTVFFSFCNVLITGGLNTSLIRKKDSDIVDYSTVLFFSLFVAIVLYIIIFFSAPYIATVYDKEVLKPVFRVMGIIFFIYAFKSVIYAYISHQLNFKRFFISTFFGTIISAAVGIILAKKGFGCWALIGQQLTNNTIDLIILLFTTKIKFKFVFSKERLIFHLKYSWKLFIASLIDSAYNELKPLVIGLRYNTVDLAYYNKGNNFPTLINTTVSNTMSSVLFSTFSKLQDDKSAMLSAVRRYIKLSSYIMFPAMMGLFVVGDELITLLLTEKWLPAVPFLRIFCFVYMFDLIHVGNLHAIKALGRTDISLILEIIKKVSYFIIIFLFVYFSKSTFIFALCNILCSVVGTLVNTYPNRKLLGYSYRLQFLDLSNNFLCALLMCGIVYSLKYLPINGVVLMIIQVFVGVISYALLSFLFKNDNLMYILNLVKGLLKSKKA